MVADHYRADTENGDHVDDPSEGALFMLISDLNDTGNTFVVIQSDADDPARFVSVGALDEGGYEVVRRDTGRREHDVTIETCIDQIAGELTKWPAIRAIHDTARPLCAPRSPERRWGGRRARRLRGWGGAS